MQRLLGTPSVALSPQGSPEAMAPLNCAAKRTAINKTQAINQIDNRNHT